jgi:hypothetical protein
MDFTGTTVLQGQIVRLRKFGESSGDSPSNLTYWCAVDEGRARDIKAFGLSGELFHPLKEGDVVRAVAGRRLGWIRKIEVLDRARPRDIRYDDTGDHLIDAPENLGEVKVVRRPAPREVEGGVRPDDLVTPADIRRAVGVDVGPAEPYGDTPLVPAWARVRSIRYRSKAGVTVDVHAGTGRRSRLLMVGTAVMTRAEGRHVEGLGMNAMLHPGVVSVVTERGTFLIAVVSSSGPPPPEAMLDLARSAADRMSALPQGAE